MKIWRFGCFLQISCSSSRGDVAQVVERSPPMPKVVGSNPGRCRCGSLCATQVGATSFGRDVKPRSSLCTHAFHHTRTIKILTLTEEENLWGPATYRHVSSMHRTSPKTECGRLRAGKLKAVTYAYPPRHEENAEEEEEEIVFLSRKKSSIKAWCIHYKLPSFLGSLPT